MNRVSNNDIAEYPWGAMPQALMTTAPLARTLPGYKPVDETG
jgi:hypothetical protein